MAFRFSLSSVLRFRESIERQEELSLQQAEAEVVRVQREIDELIIQLSRAMELRKEALKQTVHAHKLHGIEAEIRATAELRDGLFSKLQTLRNQRDARLKLYQVAHGNRQMLDDLRGREQAAWDMDQNRAQQKRLDDIFAARWQRE